MDTTLMSEIEYINILPDMDMDDSSFLKSSFVNGNGLIRTDKTETCQQENEEQQQKISELEKMVES